MVFVKLKAKLSHSLILTNWFLEQGQAFNILGFRFPSWGQEGLERSEGTSAVRQQGVAGTVVKSRAYAVWVGGVGQLQCGPYGAQGLGLPGLQFCLFLFSGKARDLTLLPTFPPPTFLKSSDNCILKYWQLVQGGGKHPESQISKTYGPPVCDF